VKKELRPVHDDIACDVCERTILKGERTEAFLAPGGHRYRVCELCFARAEHFGWIREGAAGDTPTRTARPEQRRPLLGRLLRRPARRDPVNGPLPEIDETPPPPEPTTPSPAEVEVDDGAQRRALRKDPRHVRAVPTTAEVKVERALELFNGSEHHRAVAGLIRTLGAPWVTAMPDLDQPSAVTVVVAWELSWYRFRIDLGDEADPVVMLEMGEEVGEIDEPLRAWNASVDADGRLTTEVGSRR
jgi:hypothetical protein